MKYIVCKLYDKNQWCIRPSDWEGVWTEDWELKHGNYIALFDNEENAKEICKQLNNINEIKNILREEEILDKNDNLNEYLMSVYTLNDIKKIFELL